MGVSLGDSGTPKNQMSYREMFEKCFPLYLTYGMTYEQYWDDDPNLAKAYREAHFLRLKRKNEELWLQGIYMTHALQSTVGNMFIKKGAKPIEYPKEPLAITEKEVKERQERDARLKFERLKMAMEMRARKRKGGASVNKN